MGIFNYFKQQRKVRRDQEDFKRYLRSECPMEYEAKYGREQALVSNLMGLR